MNEHLEQIEYASIIGTLYIVISSNGLRGLYWEKQDIDICTIHSSVMKQIILELDEYFCGKRKDFTIPLDIHGTPFQLSVWKELTKIPYGKTISYSQLARLIGNEKAVRAVGSANGKNPICIIIPCHRVIASDGTLGGYLGGLESKTRLLKLENQLFSSN